MLSRLNKLEHHHQTIFGIMIAIALILLHRGVVGLMDKFVLPENDIVSFWLSVVVAIFILVSTHHAIKEK